MKKNTERDEEYTGSNTMLKGQRAFKAWLYQAHNDTHERYIFKAQRLIKELNECGYKVPDSMDTRRIISDWLMKNDWSSGY